MQIIFPVRISISLPLRDPLRLYKDKFKCGGYTNMRSYDSTASLVTSKLLLFQEAKFCSLTNMEKNATFLNHLASPSERA